MFVDATKKIEESLYGIWARSKINKASSDHSTGTGFMIYPGIIVTCSHVIHQKGDIKNPVHKELMVVRAPDIGINAEEVTLLAENPKRDIALLRIDESRNESCVVLEPNLIPRGTPVGSLGFPLSGVVQQKKRLVFKLTLRFQSAYISSYMPVQGNANDAELYETDSLMYNGSSGCPGFIENVNVWGMHNSVRLQQNQERGDTTRLAISNWVPSMRIREFSNNNGVPV